MHSGLSPAEIERLAKLAEECGEVVQMVGKVLVHGREGYHPRDVNKVSNIERLEKEIGGLRAVVQLMVVAGDISEYYMTRAQNEKLDMIHNYLHEQENKC